jgi:hypothetical protein
MANSWASLLKTENIRFMTSEEFVKKKEKDAEEKEIEKTKKIYEARYQQYDAYKKLSKEQKENKLNQEEILKTLADIACTKYVREKRELHKKNEYWNHPIDIENIILYIDNAQRIESFITNDSGYGHHARNIIASFPYQNKLLYGSWTYDNGSCSHCDSDIRLGESTEGGEFETVIMMLSEDLQEKITDGRVFESLEAAIDNESHEVKARLLGVSREFISKVEGIEDLADDAIAQAEED